MAPKAPAISALKQQHVDLTEVQSEQLTLLSGHSIAERRAMLGGRLAEEAVGCAPMIADQPVTFAQVLDLVGLEAE